MKRTALAATSMIIVALPAAATAAPSPVADSNQPAHEVAAASLPAIANDDAPGEPTADTEWRDCADSFLGSGDEPTSRCRTIQVPVDHNDPTGATEPIDVGVLPAADQDNKIGTLVVNMDAPGRGATIDVEYAWLMFDQSMIGKFDLLAISARATSAAQPCFGSALDQKKIIDPLQARPDTKGQRLNTIMAGQDFVKACQDRLSPGAFDYSSTSYAQDLEVVRQELQIDKLNILGAQGHGFVAQVYANMFPEHVRAVVVDGVIDGRSVTGDGKFASQPLAVRNGHIAASQHVFDELMAACSAAGREYCLLAEPHDEYPTAASKIAKVIELAKQGPVKEYVILRDVAADGTVVDEKEIVGSWSLADIADLAISQIDPYQGHESEIDVFFYSVWKTMIGEGPWVIEYPVGEQNHDAVATLLNRESREQAIAEVAANSVDPQYDRRTESQLLTMCNDSRFVPNVFRAGGQADQAVDQSAFFGPALAWQHVHCSAFPESTAAPQHSFDAKTEHPMLFLASTRSTQHDYAAAQRAASRYPNAALVTDESYTNASAGAGNQCVDDIVAAYLADPTTAKTATCAAAKLPFAEQLTPELQPGGAAGRGHLSAAGAERRLRQLAQPHLPGTWQRPGAAALRSQRSSQDR